MESGLTTHQLSEELDQQRGSRQSHWAELLRETPSVLFQVLSAARKAADLIAPEQAAAEHGLADEGHTG